MQQWVTAPPTVNGFMSQLMFKSLPLTLPAVACCLYCAVRPHFHQAELDASLNWQERKGRSEIFLSNYTSSPWVIKDILVTELVDICITTLKSDHDSDFHTLRYLSVACYSTTEFVKDVSVPNRKYKKPNLLREYEQLWCGGGGLDGSVMSSRELLLITQSLIT
jgi:hypothetical protein